MINRSLILIAAVLLVLSCKNNSDSNTDQQANQDSSQPFDFEYESLKQTIGNCEVAGKSCLKLDLKYPVVVNGDSKVRALINEDIQNYLIATIEMEEAEEDLQSIEAAAQRFVNTYHEFLEDEPGSADRWALEIDGKHATYDNRIIIRLISYIHTGGAHPNVYQSFTNFNLATGEEIFYEDFVKDDAAFKKLAEKYFYKTRKAMDSEMEKEDAFWGKPFYLPENFALTNKGVKLFYNNYEALAYALGPTEYTIGYKTLDGIIDINFGKPKAE